MPNRRGDEISWPSMHLFRWHHGARCGVLLWCGTSLSHKSPSHWPMKQLSWPGLHLGALLQKRETAGMRRSCAPSCRCGDKKPVNVCVTLLSWCFECYQLSFKIAQTQRGSLRNPGVGSVQNMQARSRYTSLVWASENERTADEGRGINSPSSLHLSHVACV